MHKSFEILLNILNVVPFHNVFLTENGYVGRESESFDRGYLEHGESRGVTYQLELNISSTAF